MAEFESGQDKAVRLLNERLKELQSVRGLSSDDPRFKAWHDTTTSHLRRFLSPTSPFLERFIDIAFVSQIYPAPAGHDHSMFVAGCDTADATIRAVLREIEEFGVHIGQAKSEPPGRGRSGGMQQNFYGSVTFHNQAIATDSAIQRIGQVGDRVDMSSTLKEIAELFQRSEDLSPRQVKEGLSGIETLAVEVQQDPPRRNWRAMIESGEKVLGIAEKATDLASRLAPCTSVIAALVEKAKHVL